ncbi:MAG: carbon monoxide dehydrogenase subunit G [Burkholderiaceae bacterium]
MDLKGEREIPANLETTWNALNDPETLKACVPGCEAMDQTGDNEYTAAMKFKIGPVNARFKGKLNLENVQPMTSYTIRFEGQGGVAGFGKGTADVSLEPIDAERTRLSYHAAAQVGGKIAQIGSRLVSSAAAKVAEDFFKSFERHLSEGGAGGN